MSTPQTRRRWLIEHGPATLQALRSSMLTQCYTLTRQDTAQCLTALDYAANYIPTLQTAKPSALTASALAPRADLDCLHHLHRAATILHHVPALTDIKPLL